MECLDCKKFEECEQCRNCDHSASNLSDEPCNTCLSDNPEAVCQHSILTTTG